jgi:hypothetical protein
VTRTRRWPVHIQHATRRLLTVRLCAVQWAHTFPRRAGRLGLSW